MEAGSIRRTCKNWEELVMAYFMALPGKLPGGNEEKH
jgi:hypothetical protein